MAKNKKPMQFGRRLAAILAADIAGYSKMMGANEARTVRDLKAHQSVVLPLIAQFGGRIIDTAGDGIFAEFPSALRCVECAVAIQKVMAERNATLDEDRRMYFRIGINQGDVIHDEERIYGDGVNIASRLEGIASPGDICISGKVYDEVVGKISLEIDDLGAQQLKNIAHPVKAHRIRLSGSRRIQQASPSPQQTPDLERSDRLSIAVLPFRNLGDDVEQEYFADGVVEDIISDLSRFRYLFVIAKNSSFVFKGRQANAKQVGRELGVTYILEGSIRKSGDRVRISSQLIDANSETNIWAERLDGALVDIFDLQDKMTASVVAAVAPMVERAEIERSLRRDARNLDAYDFFWRGKALLNQAMNRELISEALSLFHKAHEIDKSFTAPLGTAGVCYMLRATNVWQTDRENDIKQVIRLSRLVTEFGGDDAIALSGVGFALAYVVRDLSGGLDMIDKALKLNPNLAAAWGYSAWARCWSGEPDTALDHLARSVRLNPLDPVLQSAMPGVTALAHYVAGRFDEAAKWAEKAIRMQAGWVAATRILCGSYAMMGQLEDARNTLKRLLELDPTLTLSNLPARIGPFRRKEDVAKFVKGMEIAGLPN